MLPISLEPQEFMTSNKVIKKSAKKTRDSEKPITRKTKVVNYKNDAATRIFFVKQIGRRFYFIDYLRQFTNKNNLANKRFIRDFFLNEKGKTLADAIKPGKW